MIDGPGIREGIVPGAPKSLPTTMMMSVLEVCAFFDRFFICMSDKKDFYHQFAMTPQRGISNMCFPTLRTLDLEGTRTLAFWRNNFGTCAEKYNR